MDPSRYTCAGTGCCRVRPLRRPPTSPGGMNATDFDPDQCLPLRSSMPFIRRGRSASPTSMYGHGGEFPLGLRRSFQLPGSRGSTVNGWPGRDLARWRYDPRDRYYSSSCSRSCRPRMNNAKSMGFDAIGGPSQHGRHRQLVGTGFSISPSDQLAYVTWSCQLRALDWASGVPEELVRGAG